MFIKVYLFDLIGFVYSGFVRTIKFQTILTEGGFLFPSPISDMTLSDCGLRGAPERLGLRGILSRVGIVVMMRALTLTWKIVDSRSCARLRN
jgi:hypothetical protein